MKFFSTSVLVLAMAAASIKGQELNGRDTEVQEHNEQSTPRDIEVEERNFLSYCALCPNAINKGSCLSCLKANNCGYPAACDKLPSKRSDQIMESNNKLKERDFISYCALCTNSAHRDFCVDCFISNKCGNPAVCNKLPNKRSDQIMESNNKLKERNIISHCALCPNSVNKEYCLDCISANKCGYPAACDRLPGKRSD